MMGSCFVIIDCVSLTAVFDYSLSLNFITKYTSVMTALYTLFLPPIFGPLSYERWNTLYNVVSLAKHLKVKHLMQV